MSSNWTKNRYRLSNKSTQQIFIERYANELLSIFNARIKDVYIEAKNNAISKTDPDSDSDSELGNYSNPLDYIAITMNLSKCEYDIILGWIQARIDDLDLLARREILYVMFIKFDMLFAGWKDREKLLNIIKIAT